MKSDTRSFTTCIISCTYITNIKKQRQRQVDLLEPVNFT